jgi:hypothetical protein
MAFSPVTGGHGAARLLAQAGPHQRRTLKLHRTLMAFSPLKGGHGAAGLLAQAGPHQSRILKLRRTLMAFSPLKGGHGAPRLLAQAGPHQRRRQDVRHKGSHGQKPAVQSSGHKNQGFGSGSVLDTDSIRSAGDPDPGGQK